MLFADMKHLSLDKNVEFKSNTNDTKTSIIFTREFEIGEMVLSR